MRLYGSSRIFYTSKMFVFSFCLFVMPVQAIPVATSQLSLDWSSLNIQSMNSLQLDYTDFGSDIVAEAFNHTQNGHDFDFSDDWVQVLTADAVVAGGEASSTADQNSLQYMAAAQGPEPWSFAFAYGWRFADFIVMESGTLQVSIDYEGELFVSANGSNELAEAGLDVWLDIFSSTRDVGITNHLDEHVLISGQGTDSRSVSGTLVSSFDFIRGEEGTLWIEAESFVAQESIPEPATMWLMLLSLAALLVVNRQTTNRNRLAVS